jgi:hypothetical protein
MAHIIRTFDKYLKKENIDFVFVHGDRPEVLAAASCAVFNNIPICHIEAGDISGSVDELIRHATSKLSHQFLVADDVEATVYNAVPGQCDDNPIYTASMFKLDLSDVLSHRIIAMERTFMKELGLVYGDVVKIEGTGQWDGVWQIQDTMNKRFAGRKKIDFLVPNEIKLGKWQNIKLFCLSNKEKTNIYLYNINNKK